MNQFIEELKLYLIDDKELSPRRDSLNFKSIIDNPTFYNSGLLRIPQSIESYDSTTYYELKNLNFIFLCSNQCFDLIINDTVLFNTTQFSFINRNRYINISIRQSKYYDLNIDYVYGSLELGDEDYATNITKYICSVKWDKVLKNIIFNTPDESSAYMLSGV